MTNAAPDSPGSIAGSVLERHIHWIRNRHVMLDADLAALYEVEVRVLNQAVSRNRSRFPDDFMFRLSADEWESLRSQSVILETGRGRHRKYRPRVFTEHGILMLSTVLRGELAVRVNIAIMRSFVRMRRMLADDRELALRLAVLERRYDRQFKTVFDAIRGLMAAPPATRRIGFNSDPGDPQSSQRTPKARV